MTLPMPYPTILPPTCAQSVPVDVHVSINPRKRRRSESRPPVSINIPAPTSVSTHTHTYSSSSSVTHQQQQQHSNAAAAATLVTPPLSPPDESSFEATRAKYVESLIATTTRLLETLWPSPTTTPPPTYQPTTPCSTRLTPLPQVISSLLRRSRTSCSTLHLSLLYLVRLRNAVVGRKTVRDRIRSFSSSSSSSSSTHNLKHHPLLCPRRSFLTSLILAHKYLNDKALSNGAWARISGLAVSEINLAEREFLICVGYEVGVKEGVWERWCRGVGGWMRGSSSVTAAVGASAVCKEDGMSAGVDTRHAQPQLVVPGGKVQPSVTLTPQSEAGSESDGETGGGSEAVFGVPLVLGYDVVREGGGKRVRIV
ncbi:hypothetical protein HDV00_000885 [Rhizophlyctis rosea]|nr:hypothetical protein HDV00_000885 [Rhizophlyctis rosea]